MMKDINDYTLLISLLRCIFCVIILLPKRCYGSNCVPGIRNTTIHAAQLDYVNPMGQLYLFYGEDENLGKAMENCDGNVVVPVELKYGYNQTASAAELLQKGFLLQWTTVIDSKKTELLSKSWAHNSTAASARAKSYFLLPSSPTTVVIPNLCLKVAAEIHGSWGSSTAKERWCCFISFESSLKRPWISSPKHFPSLFYRVMRYLSRFPSMVRPIPSLALSGLVNSTSSEGEKRRSILVLFAGKTGKKTSREFLLIGGPITIIAFVSTSILLFLFIRKKYTTLKPFQHQKTMPDNKRDIECFLKNNVNLGQLRYKYSDLKKITKSFSEKLGKGGYGSVYKGKLPDSRLVAVKILNESKGNGEEFMNEVASICRTSHINIVTLVGFCFEGSSKRALVYEFMPNGSLEKFIHDPSSSTAETRLPKKLFEIAVGIAQGLDYLHRGCNMRIVHFDIKPHNILLDKDFNPKISDFGLAKLCPNRSSIVSMMFARGTIGYIAPKVFSRNFGEVPHKSDVYSYGMMILEMAVGRQNVDARGDRSSEMYFPDWIYKRLQENTVMGIDGIMSEEEELQMLVKKMIIVGLWCIQTEPKSRPSISRVVEMLQGTIESLQVPPKPYLFSPPTTAADALTY